MLVPEKKCFKWSLLCFAWQNFIRANWNVNHVHKDGFGPNII